MLRTFFLALLLVAALAGCDLDASVVGGAVRRVSDLTLCGPGQTRCDDRCVHTDTDATRCGACDRACAPGERCQTGLCVPACAPSERLCATALGVRCVATLSDPTHCGACDHRCAADEVCSRGTCAAACDPATVSCEIARDADAGLSFSHCVDLSADRSHCGA